MSTERFTYTKERYDADRNARCLDADWDAVLSLHGGGSGDSADGADEHDTPGATFRRFWLDYFILLVVVGFCMGAGCTPDPEPGNTNHWRGPRLAERAEQIQTARVMWGEGL
jgi:hypothetical protein